jgi:spermidine synthase
MSKYRSKGNSAELASVLGARMALSRKAPIAPREELTEDSAVWLGADAEELSKLPNMKQLTELLKTTRAIDLSTDPGDAFISTLKSSGKLNEHLLSLLDGYGGAPSSVKVSEHTKYAYQVKEAFSSSEEVLATFKDREGPIKVTLRDGRNVDLSFQDTDVQSRLNLKMPKRPELKYIQTMLLGPLLIPNDKLNTILVIGFGGGTLAKYYTDFYRSKTKVLVDMRPILFDVAAEHFMYSPDENTIQVPADASVFLKKARIKKDKYDLINIDIFIEGPADLQLHSYFWDDVAAVLASHGLVCTNVWKGEHEDKYQKILELHKRNFKTVFEVVNSDTHQVAMYGSQLPMEMLLHNTLYIKSAEMSGLTAVNFNTHLGNIRRLQ